MDDYRAELTPRPPVIGASGAELLYPFNSTLVRRGRAASMWIWALVAFSVGNVGLSFMRAPFRTPTALFSTELIFEVGHHIGPIATYSALVVVFFILSAFATCGFYAMRLRSWAFVGAIVFISIDSILMVAIVALTGLWEYLFWSGLYRAAAIYSLYLGNKSAKIYTERKINGQA